ncbi:arginine-hydroxylase NDUFAF5, mitochondrial [Microplitis mediator]|uniref:arginine-hydroxylase NDUFAF5, mitochondrial n=1 Tax=Microplitis mediator TaxID=375433 RepID=UPI002553A215|nr:arginine-hydroxylase NDUFAF5, mitochondrial [Microplitis mediator]
MIKLLKKRVFVKNIKRNLNTTNVNNNLPINSVMNVFDRQAKLLQKQRSARAPDVKLYDYIKDEIGYRLADRIFDIKREFENVLELGCGRGNLSKHISQDNVKNLILADMCPDYLEQVVITEDIKVQKKVMDEENFELDPNSVDLIVSCLNLHWVNDLPGCFSRIIRTLKNDGVFLAAIFGGDTLYELRSSLQLAELERQGGISPHISPFTQIRDIGSLMTRAGFTMLTIDTDEMVIGFPSMFELMTDLKGMGESNAARNRTLHLKRDTLVAAAAIYEELYGKLKEDGSRYVPATFQIIYMLGWKPDPSQPKPLDRGTGEVSLKDLYKLDEIVRGTTKIKLGDDDK